MIELLIVSVDQLRTEEIVALWWAFYQFIRDQFIEICLESLSNIFISFQIFYYENLKNFFLDTVSYLLKATLIVEFIFFVKRHRPNVIPSKSEHK